MFDNLIPLIFYYNLKTIASNIKEYEFLGTKQYSVLKE